MQILQMIAERAGTAQNDADLDMIHNLWRQADQTTASMRSTDRIAIRRAAAALDRVGAALTSRLSPGEKAIFRALPAITATTRVRKIPKSFWLEISLLGQPGDWSTQPVLFVEVQSTAISFGVRLPDDVDVLGKKTIRTLRRHNRNCDDEAQMWRFERKILPGAQQDCSNDLNTWLARRSADTRQKPGHLTLNRICPPGSFSMKELEDGLNDAIALFGRLLALN